MCTYVLFVPCALMRNKPNTLPTSTLQFLHFNLKYPKYLPDIISIFSFITWYFKTQLTLVFQGQDGPFLKEKLFKLVQDKPEMTTDSPNRSTNQNENQQTTDNGADSGSENSLFAELRDIKYSLTVLKK